MPDVTLAFESYWLGQVWPPAAVLGNRALNKDVFTRYPSLLDVGFKPIPPHRHNKNVPESKHGAGRSIFLRMICDRSSNLELAVLQAVRISNDLYG